MATGVASWSTTAATNSTADSAVNWAEGQAPSSVNDSGRAMMASVAKWRDDISGTITTGGTSTAYTATTNQSFATAAAMSGALLCIIPHATSGATPTLAVDGLTARQINQSTGVAVATGALIVGTPYLVTYIHASTEFILVGRSSVFTTLSATGNATVGGTLGVTGATTLSSTLGVTGAATLSSTLAVTGATTLSSTLAVTGAVSTTAGVTVGSGFTVSAGAVLLPAGSIASAALAAAPAKVFISTQSASSSAQIDFTSGLDDTYDHYELVVSSAKPATDDVIPLIRVGTGGGPTYQTSGYTWATSGQTGAGPTALASGSTSDGSIQMSSTTAANGVGNASGESWSGTIKFNDPEASNLFSMYYQAVYNRASDGVTYVVVGAGSYNSVSAITAIRFLFTSGNIASGRFTLYGYRKS